MTYARAVVVLRYPSGGDVTYDLADVDIAATSSGGVIRGRTEQGEAVEIRPGLAFAVTVKGVRL